MIVSKHMNYIANRDTTEVYKYLENLKKEKDIRVIDIGGGPVSWIQPYLTHVVDLFNYHNDLPNIKFFNIDIESELQLNELLKDVEENGKFDFVNCTHTIEDLHNPTPVLNIINKIGDAGYIAVPSKFAEFCPNIDMFPNVGTFKGYHHHRWVWGMLDDVLIGYPKQNTIEGIQLKELPNPQRNEVFQLEIGFMWKDNFEFKIWRGHDLFDNLDPPRRHNNQWIKLVSEDDFPWRMFKS